MKTIQMTIDDELLAAVDRTITELDTSRSAFIRGALQSALQIHRTGKLEKRHREGYRKHPVQPGEFDLWEQEQQWGE